MSQVVVHAEKIISASAEQVSQALADYETVVEEVANLLGVEPESVDPEG